MGRYINMFGKIFGKKENSKLLKISYDEWGFYRYFFGDNNELLALIRYNKQADREDIRSILKIEKRLIVPVPSDNVMANGLPTKEVNQDLSVIENKLLDLFKDKNIGLFGVMTYH